MGSIVQLLLLATLSVALANDFPFSAILESDPATQKPVYAVDWGFNRMDATITFRLILNSTGWFGFGLSPTGGMKDSDLVVGWVTTDGKVMLYVSTCTMRNTCKLTQTIVACECHVLCSSEVPYLN